MNLMMLLEMARRRASATAWPSRVEGPALPTRSCFEAAGAAAREVASSGCERMALARREQPGAGGPLRQCLGGRAVRPAQLPPHRDGVGKAAEGDRSLLPGNGHRSGRGPLEAPRHHRRHPRTLPGAGHDRLDGRAQLADGPRPDRDPSLHTSGTTGPSQGGPASPTSIWSRTSSAPSSSPRPPRTTRHWWSVPPYHVAGMAAIASSVYAGRRIVQLPTFSAEAWPELARSERVTNAFVVPTMLARVDRGPLGRRECGAPLSPGPLLRWRKDAPVGDREGDEALSRHRLHQRLRTHRDQLDHLPSGSRRTSRRRRERRSRHPAPSELGGGCPLPSVEVQIATNGKSLWPPANAARSTCAVSRSPANTSAAARPSTRRAGSPPVTAARWMARDTSSSRAAPTTSSCAAARTCRRERSRTCCSKHEAWPTQRSSESPTSSGERQSPPRW